jgi:hypothetical protein
LLDFLVAKPTAYLDEMVMFLWDEFGLSTSESTVSRALKRLRISRKILQQQAAQRSKELRDHWMVRLSEWTSEQLVFIDESAANERTADRKYGWAPIGQKAIDSVVLKRSERYSILPAYTIDGYVTWMIRQGSITSSIFIEFIEEYVLPICNEYPGPRSVLIMDNASIHCSEVCKYNFYLY